MKACFVYVYSQQSPDVTGQCCVFIIRGIAVLIWHGLFFANLIKLQIVTML